MNRQAPSVTRECVVLAPTSWQIRVSWGEVVQDEQRQRSLEEEEEAGGRDP